MNSLYLYEISEEYLSFLKSAEKHIFSSKEDQRRHVRKYLGCAYTINHYNYYIPLSSPKRTDYYLENDELTIRNSIIPIIRIISYSSSGKAELLGTLKLSNMIPVPLSELTLYDLSNEPDFPYKCLISNKDMTNL